MDVLAFNAAYDRLLEVFGVKTQMQLAAFLDVRQSSISDAKRRRNIPSGWLLAAVVQKGVNPLWILSGEGCQYLHPGDGVVAVAEPMRPLQERSVEDMLLEIQRRVPGAEVRLQFLGGQRDNITNSPIRGIEECSGGLAPGVCADGLIPFVPSAHG